MAKKSDKAQILYDECAGLVNNPDRRERVQQWKKENQFYHNAQWEDAEASDLEATGQTDIVLNTMRRAFRTLLSQIVAASPTAKFMPRNMGVDDQAKQTLDSLPGLFDNSWYISDGDVLMRRVAQKMLVVGQGWMHVKLDPAADYYRGEVVFEDRDPWDMVVPLNANKMDFSDAKKIFYRKRVPLVEAIEILGKPYADLLRSESVLANTQEIDYDTNMRAPDYEQVYDSAIDWSGLGWNPEQEDENMLVEWIECQKPVKHPAKLFKISDATGIVNTIIYDPVNEKDLNKFDPEKFLRQQNIEYDSVEQRDIKVDRIEHQILAGRSIIAIEPQILPISHYASIPFIDEDTHNPLSQGEAFFVKSAQKLLNKVFSLAVLHLQTSGSGDKLVGWKGAFGSTPEEVETFQKMYTNPSSVTELGMEYTDGLNITDVIKQIPGTPLQPAAVQTISLLTGWIDRLTGISPLSWGDPSGAPRTLGATISVKEWGDENSRIPLLHISYALRKLGHVWLEMALNHYTYAKQVAVPDQFGKINEYYYNWPNNGLIANELEGIQANIYITSGMNLMLNRYAMMTIFKELMPIHPIFVKLFVMYSDIPDKFQIIQEMDYTANLEQKIQELAPMMDKLQKQTRKDEQTIESLEKKQALTKFNSLLKQVETKAKAEFKIQLAEHEANLEVIEAQAKARHTTSLSKNNNGSK